jgi:SAM-dependent methyltransferase
MDSRQWWSRAHGGPMAASDPTPSEFVVEVASKLDRPCRILEIGCGAGQDSLHFARAGHRVVASDFVRQHATWDLVSRASSASLAFVLLDLRDPLPFSDAAFDVVYARLCLHYFTDGETSRIFGEIRRLLTPGGLLAFLCKSTSDPLYGRGEPVGRDMFRINDKVYHFFDESFARRCLGDRITVEDIWSGPAQTYGEPSHVVRVYARRDRHVSSTTVTA